MIRDRDLPLAKLVPFTSEDARAEELLLATTGSMRLPEAPFDIDKLWKMPKARVAGRRAVQAVIEERDETR